LLLAGEPREWETVEYVADAIAEGRHKALIILSHVPSEQFGMDECAKWLKTFVTEVPIEFVPTKDPFAPLRPPQKIGSAIYELEKRKTESTTCSLDWASQQVTLCPPPRLSRDFLLALFWRFHSPPTRLGTNPPTSGLPPMPTKFSKILPGRPPKSPLRRNSRRNIPSRSPG